MKRVRINAYQAGLAFRNGVYQQLLSEGSYWFWNKERIYLLDLTQPFRSPVELRLLLQDEALAKALEVVEVNDNEIVLQYRNGLLHDVLTAGQHAFWKGVVDYRFVRVDISNPMINETVDRSVLHHQLVTPLVRRISIEAHEKAVLFIDGKFEGILGGGVHYWWKNDIAVQVVRADTRQQQLELNGQEILTRDKAALRINAWIQYRITDIERALLQHKDYEKQAYILAQLALREYVAGFGFDELLEKKADIGLLVQEKVQRQAAELGIAVAGFGIRDIILPGDMKEIMNQVLVAEKKAQANTIMRREETASTRSLLNTARLMEENAMLWRLKEMEYVEKIAEKISHISVNGDGRLIEQLKQLFAP